MPLWKIYHGPGTLSTDEKTIIAKGATSFYAQRGFPSWYVNVLFFELNSTSFYTGGLPKSQTVGVEIIHIARHWDPTNKQAAVAIKNGVDAILGPFTTKKGLHLEFAVLEGPAELWRINGIDPPEAFGPDEQEQAEKNRQILFERYGA
ncbi:Tautomerase [Penicillium lividum]|nr:Tautomerase [Penicillium lividum]